MLVGIRTMLITKNLSRLQSKGCWPPDRRPMSNWKSNIDRKITKIVSWSEKSTSRRPQQPRFSMLTSFVWFWNKANKSFVFIYYKHLWPPHIPSRRTGFVVTLIFPELCSIQILLLGCFVLFVVVYERGIESLGQSDICGRIISQKKPFFLEFSR